MTPIRPYYLRATYDWIVANEGVPFLSIDATLPGVEVPQGLIQDGRIVFNIAPKAVKDLVLGNWFIRFHARFAKEGSVFCVIPIAAVNALYEQVTHEGYHCVPEDMGEDSEPDLELLRLDFPERYSQSAVKAERRAHLTLVKSECPNPALDK